MANFLPQGTLMANIFNQLTVQNNDYTSHSQLNNLNDSARQDTSGHNESKPGAIVGTCFEMIRPYFRISQIDVLLNIKDIFLPIKPRTRLLDLYLPSVSISTFILLSTINRILSDNSSTTNPAEILARVASWIISSIILEASLLKFFFFILKVQTNTMIIPHDVKGQMLDNGQDLDPYRQQQNNLDFNSSRCNYVHDPAILQSDGVPVLAILSVSGYKFTPLSFILSISLLYSGNPSFWINSFKFYSYIAASINAFRCFEGLHLTTFNNYPALEMRQPNLSHIYLLIYIASAMQFIISWGLMPKQST
ncbi:hypothetical protein BMR1_01G02795 [Babesia microti strain RI]|uniref:Uncharacterized protein n=1 Tax=Babesia microti (strain RI) TaxID=1133968 RepID=A0A1N6LX17_BABMR|nr:hypothetical protein BMR1_01G02795 [Babesia microti strain RI]SIO73417.1 hypothetical protein BMR1_01G02795 [Babesia microti strain RI]|eukprot:XP_012647622.2 hypothetical protein BMR1_01G02795 [Babesia microti strain RI]